MFVFTVESIKNLNKLTYSHDAVDNERLDNIEYSKTKGLFKDFNYDKYLLNPPPKNTSMQVVSELEYLRDLPIDVKFVKEHDDIEKIFENICIEHNVEYPTDLVKELIKSSAGIILDLKYKFNRPRPAQMASHYNIKLGKVVLESMESPAYPSGHSAQGILIGKVLQTKLSISTNAFSAAGKRISYSRNMGRAHFPSDSKIGEDLGNELYNFIKHKI